MHIRGVRCTSVRTLRQCSRRIAVTEREQKISEFCFDRMKAIRLLLVLVMPASALGRLPCVENQRCTRASAYLHGSEDGVSGRLDIVQGCNLQCTGQQYTPKVSSEAHNSTKDLRTDEHYLRSVKVFFSQRTKKSIFFSRFFFYFYCRHQ